MKKRLYCSPQRKICGVCGGLADYFNIDPSLVRLAFVEIALFTAVMPCLLAYFVMALIIPQPTKEYEQMYPNNAKRLYKSNEKKLFGVCGGIADYFNIDPTIVRLVFFLLVLLVGNGVLTYIACAIIFPRAPQEATAQDYGYTPPFEQPQPEPQPEPQPDPAADEPTDEQN